MQCIPGIVAKASTCCRSSIERVMDFAASSENKSVPHQPQRSCVFGVCERRDGAARGHIEEIASPRRLSPRLSIAWRDTGSAATVFGALGPSESWRFVQGSSRGHLAGVESDATPRCGGAPFSDRARKRLVRQPSGLSHGGS